MMVSLSCCVSRRRRIARRQREAGLLYSNGQGVAAVEAVIAPQDCQGQVVYAPVAGVVVKEAPAVPQPTSAGSLNYGAIV